MMMRFLTMIPVHKHLLIMEVKRTGMNNKGIRMFSWGRGFIKLMTLQEKNSVSFTDLFQL